MPDGATEGEHKRSGLEQWEKLPAALKPKPAAVPAVGNDIPKEKADLPEALRYLWLWFIDLHNGCGSSGFGPVQVTWGDLHAWAAMTGMSPAPWEVDALMRLSLKFVEARSEKKPGEA